MKIIAELMAEMFEDCWKCGGTGNNASEGTSADGRVLKLKFTCRLCSGTGEVLTEDGQVLFDRLLPYLRREFPVHEHEHGI